MMPKIVLRADGVEYRFKIKRASGAIEKHSLFVQDIDAVNLDRMDIISQEWTIANLNRGDQAIDEGW